MATHQRIHLGKAQEEQELEKDSEGTPTKTQTFNLIEFLLKNGPPSIISNFKYDLYQLRVFESYSNYVDGTDKGEPSKPSLMQSGNVPKQSSTCSTMNNSSRRKGWRPRPSGRRCPTSWAARPTVAVEAEVATEEADTEEVDMEAEGTIMATEAMATTSRRKRRRTKRRIPITTATQSGTSGTTPTTSPPSTSTGTRMPKIKRTPTTSRPRRKKSRNLRSPYRPKSPSERQPPSWLSQEPRSLSLWHLLLLSTTATQTLHLPTQPLPT